MQGACAIGFEEARQLLTPLRSGDRILLAVSGGPDSIALMHLAAEVATNQPWPPIVVASVDHQLQRGSAEIAADVIGRAHALGFAGQVLTWHGLKPESGIQKAARTVRYGLLSGFAAEIGASHLVTAHTLDDQAETILFRMARGSGPVGLIGMRRAVDRGGVTHLRPFLAIAKDRLLATCRHNEWRFVEDAANQDPRYARTRLRTLMPLLAAEGLDAETLAALGERLAVADAALVSAAQVLNGRAQRPAAPGQRAFDAAQVFSEPRAVVTALLNQALSDFCRAGPPRLSRLEALVQQLDQAWHEGRRLRRTLHGARVSLTIDARLELEPEPRRRRGVRPDGAPGSGSSV